jgi:glycosyltransferase involved in cell wall biosynthesis
MLLSIIVPTFNRPNIAEECIKSILETNIPDAELIIVNDYKPKEFILSKNYDSTIPFRIVSNPLQGVASARNYGASLATGKYLIFIDDDMIVNKAVFVECLNFLIKNSNFTYNANWEYRQTELAVLERSNFGKFIISINFHNLKGWNNNPIDWEAKKFFNSQGITSQFLGLSKEIFEKVNGYNERFPFAGFEDYDFAKKLEKIGVKTVIDTSVRIYHNEIDKLNLKSWLERKYRGGYTQKSAFELGYVELQRSENWLKKLTFIIIYKFRAFFLLILELFFKSEITLKLYIQLVNLLTGSYLCAGYNRI